MQTESVFDGFDANAGCDSNRWSSDEITKANQSCVQ
jgi:hypothetical protein